jgi:hypothetical protein
VCLARAYAQALKAMVGISRAPCLAPHTSPHTWLLTPRLGGFSLILMAPHTSPRRLHAFSLILIFKSFIY